MSTIINGSSPSITFSDSTTQTTAFTGSASQITSGTLPSAQLPTGSVLQVVQATTTNGPSTTSTSFVTTSFSGSITPKFSTSKILAIVTGQLYETAASNQGFITLYRGGSNLGDATQGFAPNVYSGSNITGGASFSYLDSPATTSSTTYTVYFRTTGGTVYFNGANGLATIILMEIAG